MQKVGVGVIGLGYAGLKHLKAYIQNPRTEVKGVCDKNEKLLHSISQEYGIKLATVDYEELVAQKDIDIVSICTPDHLHTEPSIKALEAGKHVFCEKPLATTIEDCRKIIRVVKDTGLKFLTGQILRFAPFFISLKKIYDEGELGEAFFAESDYLQDARFLLSGWRVDPQNPQDMVLGGGVHTLDLLRWIIGEIEEVHAFANKKSLVDTPLSNDCIILSLKFKNGCIGKGLISVGCIRPYALNLSIYGTKGTLINNKLFLDKIPGLQDFISIPLPIENEFPYFGKEIDHLLNCIEKDKTPLVDAVEGAKTVATCLAGISSIKEGKAVKVEATF